MDNHRELTEVITGRYDAERICDALNKSWELQGRSSYEAVVCSAAERRVRRRLSAQHYGITLQLEGE